MKNGRLHQTDVNNVKMLGDFIRSTFKDNLADIAEITTTPEQDAEGKNADLLRVDDYENVFRNKAGDRELTIHLQWTEKKKLSYLVLKEAIPFSQRVEKFSVCIRQKMEEKRKWWMLPQLVIRRSSICRA